MTTKTVVPVSTPWPGPLEHELVPYRPWSDWSDRTILVLAPHPDDEVLGCGGLLAQSHRMGWRSHVVVVSDGGLGGDPATREAESRAAADVLISDFHSGKADQGSRHSMEFWRLPDRSLLPGEVLRQRIMDAVAATAAQWVIAPSPFEVHPDHRAVCRASIEATAALQSKGCEADLIFCEIGQPQIANMLVDISAVAATKTLAVKCFKSQLDQQPYHDQVAGLNRQRSYTLGPSVMYAEAYWRVAPEELADGVDGVLGGIFRQLKRRL